MRFAARASTFVSKPIRSASGAPGNLRCRAETCILTTENFDPGSHVRPQSDRLRRCRCFCVISWTPPELCFVTTLRQTWQQPQQSHLLFQLTVAARTGRVLSYDRIDFAHWAVFCQLRPCAVLALLESAEEQAITIADNDGVETCIRLEPGALSTRSCKTGEGGYGACCHARDAAFIPTGHLELLSRRTSGKPLLVWQSLTATLRGLRRPGKSLRRRRGHSQQPQQTRVAPG